MDVLWFYVTKNKQAPFQTEYALLELCRSKRETDIGNFICGWNESLKAWLAKAYVLNLEPDEMYLNPGLKLVIL